MAFFNTNNSATLLKKRLWHRCFSCEFCEISKSTSFCRAPLDDCFGGLRKLSSSKNRVLQNRVLLLQFIYKSVSPPRLFFFVEKTLFYMKMLNRNDTTTDKNINISSLKYNCKTVFELMQIEI